MPPLQLNELSLRKISICINWLGGYLRSSQQLSASVQSSKEELLQGLFRLRPADELFNKFKTEFIGTETGPDADEVLVKLGRELAPKNQVREVANCVASMLKLMLRELHMELVPFDWAVQVSNDQQSLEKEMASEKGMEHVGTSLAEELLMRMAIHLSELDDEYLVKESIRITAQLFALLHTVVCDKSSSMTAYSVTVPILPSLCGSRSPLKAMAEYRVLEQIKSKAHCVSTTAKAQGERGGVEHSNESGNIENLPNVDLQNLSLQSDKQQTTVTSKDQTPVTRIQILIQCGHIIASVLKNIGNISLSVLLENNASAIRHRKRDLVWQRVKAIGGNNTQNATKVGKTHSKSAKQSNRPIFCNINNPSPTKGKPISKHRFPFGKKLATNTDQMPRSLDEYEIAYPNRDINALRTFLRSTPTHFVPDLKLPGQLEQPEISTSTATWVASWLNCIQNEPDLHEIETVDSSSTLLEPTVSNPQSESCDVGPAMHKYSDSNSTILYETPDSRSQCSELLPRDDSMDVVSLEASRSDVRSLTAEEIKLVQQGAILVANEWSP